jgi:hypothetical protein
MQKKLKQQPTSGDCLLSQSNNWFLLDLISDLIEKFTVQGVEFCVLKLGRSFYFWLVVS